MEKKKSTEGKQAKVLKCTNCGKEYIFDNSSRNCPACGSSLKAEIVLMQ